MKRSKAIYVICLLVINGCSDDNQSIDTSNISVNYDVENQAQQQAYSAVSSGAEITTVHAAPLKKGRWDPPSIVKKPLSGGSRSRQIKYSKMINQEARKAGMDPRFVHAIISRESRYKTMAKSHAGAMGLMQLMPNTSKMLGLPPHMRASHPTKNVRAGIKYLAQMKWAKGNMQAMAAGYNSGPARAKALLRKNTKSRYWRSSQVSSSNGVPGPKFWKGETYNYARHVAGFYDLYSANPHLIGLASKTRKIRCERRGIC